MLIGRKYRDKFYTKYGRIQQFSWDISKITETPPKTSVFWLKFIKVTV
jgi:hypothetical protein